MLGAVHNLGNLYRSQGKLSEAEKMYHQVLEGHEKVLGQEHTSTLNIVNNMGKLYADQGKLALHQNNIQAGFAATGLVPYSPDRVLAQLHTKY